MYKPLCICLFLLIISIEAHTLSAQPTVQLSTDGQAQRRFVLSEFTPETWLPRDFEYPPVVPVVPEDSTRKREEEEEEKNDFKEETRLFLTGSWGDNSPVKQHRLPIATISVQVSFWVCLRSECFNESSAPSITMYSYSDVMCELITFQEMTTGSAASKVISYVCHVSKLLETAIPTLLQLKAQTLESRTAYFGVSLLTPKESSFLLHTNPNQPCTFAMIRPHHWTGAMKGGNFKTAEVHPYYNECESIGIRMNRVLALKSSVSKHSTYNEQIIHVGPSVHESASDAATSIVTASNGEANGCTFPCFDVGLTWIGITGLFVAMILFKFCKYSRKPKVYRAEEVESYMQSD